MAERVRAVSGSAARGPAATARLPGLLLAIALVSLTVVATLAATPAGAESGDPAYPGQRRPTAGFGGTVAEPDKVVDIDVPEDIERGVPVVPGAFADPFLLEEDEADYVYATNTSSANIPALRISHDGSKAGYLGDAMPELPSWTTKGFQWAPSVWARPDGEFVLFYSTPAPGGSPRQCISAATADSPSGPFTDSSSDPMICPLSEGGAIDPSPFVDGDGDPYLLWKSDGNCCGMPTTIYSQPLSSDGLSTDGDPTALITDTQDWEKGIVEAPSMVKDGSTYWLFYSGNDWNTEDYSMGIASCSSLQGPCTKPLDRAWQSSAGAAEGPGGQEFFSHADGERMVHHGWLPGAVDTAGSVRRLFLDAVTFDGSDLPRRDDSALALGESADAGWLRPVLVALALLAALTGLLLARRHRGQRRS